MYWICGSGPLLVMGTAFWPIVARVIRLRSAGGIVYLFTLTSTGCRLHTEQTSTGESVTMIPTDRCTPRTR